MLCAETQNKDYKMNAKGDEVFVRREMNFQPVDDKGET